MDALTISLARGVAGISPEIAVEALIIGILSNTALKTAVSLTLGSPAFRWRAALGLALIAAGLVGSLFVLR
jgi:hypothetical protein